MTEQDRLLTLKKLILDKLNFDLGQYKESYLERRVNTRINLTHTGNLYEYIKLLEKDQAELMNLMDSLTVNVTEFFRNIETFETLEKDIIPKIINNNSSRDIIKVWSAGCSSGEELYTLTILFLEALGKSGKQYKLLVQGTDIDRKSLTRARIGRYRSEKVRSIRKDLLEKYFENDGTYYNVKPHVKKHVKINHLDLSSDFDKLSITYELILCRNVVIYFNKDVKQAIFMKFYNMLQKDGFLVLGKNESITGDALCYLENVNISERVYKKTLRGKITD
ncbi:MAG: protein-glutamate O-methyltransferase CheR [ANME-2 cluster archaeon]|nr:protein-glutamate O-methyltransferase CheR [ANME-2 cluster archaeon]